MCNLKYLFLKFLQCGMYFKIGLLFSGISMCLYNTNCNPYNFWDHSSLLTSRVKSKGKPCRASPWAPHVCMYTLLGNLTLASCPIAPSSRQSRNCPAISYLVRDYKWGMFLSRQEGVRELLKTQDAKKNHCRCFPLLPLFTFTCSFWNEISLSATNSQLFNSLPCRGKSHWAVPVTSFATEILYCSCNSSFTFSEMLPITSEMLLFHPSRRELWECLAADIFS